MKRLKTNINVTMHLPYWLQTILLRVLLVKADRMSYVTSSDDTILTESTVGRAQCIIK